MDITITPGTGTLGLTGAPPKIAAFQFVGLARLAEFNAQMAHASSTTAIETAYALNTLLVAYAALEALTLETAYVVHPELYADRRYRFDGLPGRAKKFLDYDGRQNESIPASIAEIDAYRQALTHSEPDNRRTTQVGSVLNADSARRFAKEIRDIAKWLWNGRRPRPVATEFDDPNLFLIELRPPAS